MLIKKLIIGLVLLLSSNATVDSSLNTPIWPMYCHDTRHTCQSPFNGLVTKPKKPKWIFPSPGGEGGFTSSIAIDGSGKIYAGSAQNEDFKKNKLIGYSGVLNSIFPNGKKNWQHDSKRGTPMISMIESSPLVTPDNKIIYGKDDGHVYALDQKGKLLWDFATDDPYNPELADDNEQMIPSPVLSADKTLYVVSHWGNVYSKQRVGGWIANPQLKTVIDKYKIKGIDKDSWSKLYAIDSQNGKRKWVFDFSSNNSLIKKTSLGSPALGADGTIYVATYDKQYNGYIYAINKDGSLKWVYPKDSNTKIQGLQSSPAIGNDGTIYVGSFGNKNKANLYSFNADGSLKWIYEITENRITSGPGIGLDGSLYFGSHDYPPNPNKPSKGNMYFLQDIQSKPNLKWKFEVNHGIVASPAIDKNGNVFFSTSNPAPNYSQKYLGTFQLFALNNKGKKLWDYSLNGYSWGAPSIGKDGTIYLSIIKGEAGVAAFSY